MRGFVPTPPKLVEAMVHKLFSVRPPRATDTLLDPGCGNGAFIRGVVNWCECHGHPVPRIVGVESDSRLLGIARQIFANVPQVTLLHEDFLTPRAERFDFVIGNPPYVPITGLTADERARYRARYQVARGRFDLYLLFFEQALSLLKADGRLVFVTPEKFLYVETADPLRRLLGDFGIEEIELIDEASFGSLVTYPTITTISRSAKGGASRVFLRNGERRDARLDISGESWINVLNGNSPHTSGPTLADAFVRISCGVATGADDVYVLRDNDVPDVLRGYAHPTVAGRELQLGGAVRTAHSMLVPYSRRGALIAEDSLGALGDFLRAPDRRERLKQRTCVARKAWYAFHENPPLPDILRPKILCKDIGPRPWFTIDERGEIVPRHSVYYLVPRDPSMLGELCEYLNSREAVTWLESHCQRAANGFVRLQSHVLKRLPVPTRFAAESARAVG